MKCRAKSWTRNCGWVMAVVVPCVMGLAMLAGCGGGSSPDDVAGSSPDDVVKKFYEASEKEDWEGMMACVAPGVRQIMNQAKAWAEENKEPGWKPTNAGVFGKSQGKVEDFKIVNTQVNGDWADVTTSVTLDGQARSNTVKVHKIDGTWLLDMTDEQKANMQKGLAMMKKLKEMKEKGGMPDLEKLKDLIK